MLQFSLVFMLQNRGPRQKTRLMTDIITFGVGNSTILNQDGKTKILSCVACFYSKCLAKIVFWRAASWLLRHLDAAISAEQRWLGCYVITKLKGDFCWAVIKGNVLGIKAHKEPRRPGRNRRGNVSPICKNVKLAYFSFLFWIWIT